MLRVSKQVDPFTGKSSKVVNKRSRARSRNSSDAHWERVRIMTEANNQLMSACEDVNMEETTDMVCATRTPPAKKRMGPKSRQGARKVKSMER